MARRLECFQPLTGISAIKDLNSVYQNMSERFANVLGWNGATESYGKTDHDIPCDVRQFAAKFITMDREVLSTGKKMLTIDLQNYRSGWNLLLIEKNVLRDLQGKHIGVYLQAVDLSTTNLIQGYKILCNLDEKMRDKSPKPISYILNETNNFSSLTIKQQKCLFYLIRGKSMKEVAKILEISHRTVESHIQTIKDKLQCTSKSELIEKVIDEGFLYSVPKCLLNTIFGYNI